MFKDVFESAIEYQATLKSLQFSAYTSTVRAAADAYSNSSNSAADTTKLSALSSAQFPKK